MNNREELPEFLNSLGLTGKGVEVGVESGYFSNIILKNSSLHILFSIDNWCEYSDYPSGQICKPQERHEESMLAAIKTLKPYGKRSQIFRLKSVEAAKLFQDHELDFVYIDAAHSYVECTNNILAWFPKVKPSGILAGHDYMDGDFGVRAAVNDFVSSHDVDLQIIVDGAPSWYFKV